MQSDSKRGASKTCFHGCFSSPFLTLPEPNDTTPNYTSSNTFFQHSFTAAAISSLHPNTQFTNHESLPSMEESFSNFNNAFPQYSNTLKTDEIRAQEYHHLSNQTCLDYIGHGLFSYSQQQNHSSSPSIASTSSFPPPTHSLNYSCAPFFYISYKSVNLTSQLLHGGKKSEFEFLLERRIMKFMNVSEDDYSMVFTANQSSAFKLVADSYPFDSNRNLLTTYDHETDASDAIIYTSKKKGARVMSAEFAWPSLRIHSRKLRKILENTKKKKKRKMGQGLFIFPLQSRMTGATYSPLWMNIARENGWHVLLDACALGAKDMETLGLSLFQPDFLICSFFKVFGDNPSGFSCLFVKKSSASLLNNSNTSIGIVSIVPDSRLYVMNASIVQSSSEIVELDSPGDIAQCSQCQNQDFLLGGTIHRITESSEIKFNGLDHADSLGLILISSRRRYLVNWLVNALTSLKHPHSENGHPSVRIYGPNIRFDRGPSISFNIFDWKGEKVDPKLVQKLADRSKISLNYGVLQNMLFLDQYSEEREKMLERSSADGGAVGKNKKIEKKEDGVAVITVSLGLLTNFDDVYRVWVFVSRFLDADFVEKERWRYMRLNQMTVEV